ncbi:esterase family protein [Lapillicoccus jejuensis]|uniref:Esterase/lipase superfamily enzyme n=1 Tax=Lapillicoccus jejuensis TaxID=402171 RepID=A0A542E609_9MICO|nr:hypothetical protein [Lapillicoccus jejuensis]TQJ10734.1 esterase/lipase superfamily enzyme [Lapillicoccus jejuensis]
MDKAVERWWSPRLYQDLTLARWGHYGTPLLLFPTAGGDAEEVERMGLLDSIGHLVEAGAVKVYSVDSLAGRALARREGDPAHRMWLFNAFHRAVEHEVVPAVHMDCGGPVDLVTAGASIGAFNAVAMVARFPRHFRAALGMSGTYDLQAFLGESNDDLYYASPLQFLPGLHGEDLDVLRSRFLLLAAGTGRWEDIGESWRLANVLGEKGIPNRVDDWGPHRDHDWPTWREMLPTYLPQLL